MDTTISGPMDKSLPKTAQRKRISSPLNEAISLLISWNLPQLCEAFRYQEVCTVAFQHISDTDINMLIPKIGPRSIFRARLFEWRQNLQKSQANRTQATGLDKRKQNIKTAFTQNNINYSNNENSNEHLVESTEIKMESFDGGEQWNSEWEDEQAHDDESLSDAMHHLAEDNAEVELINGDSEFIPDESDVDNINTSNSNSSNIKKGYPNTRKKLVVCYSREHNHERVAVKDILEKCVDGRKAIEYYAANKTLDANHRKKIVKNVTSVVIQKRIAMTVNCFHDLAQQFVNLFPNENYDTYYVPRNGSTCPKGALYNKYLNMCRRLRRDGLLEYRVQRKVSHNNKSK